MYMKVRHRMDESRHVPEMNKVGYNNKNVSRDPNI